MPIHVNSGSAGPIGSAFAINAGLILLWSLQHSIMARPGFKKTWTTIVPKAMERSTYVLISGVLMILIALNWQALDGMLWDVENSAARTLLNVLHVSGWAIAVMATFLINHVDLFGLQQV
jgi:protein-S-isoprenylcysteine O-methyltransferase Ste14